MDVENEETGLRHFCHLMLNCPHTTEMVWAGSTFELPIIFTFENVTDVDILICLRQVRVLPYNSDFPEATLNHVSLSNNKHWVTATEFWPKKTVLKLYSKNSHIGYTQLVYDDERNKGKIAINHDLRGSDNCDVSNTSTWLQESEQIWKMYESFIKCDNNLSHLKGVTIDLVDCLRYPVWPEEANEWITRNRNHCWPSLEIIESIVANGCHLVAKSHDTHVENISEWRFSFSIAELTLIQSLNYEQKFIYHILRLIKYDVIRKCEEIKQSQLKTYHFKTLMLWTSEEQPSEFWKKENLESSLEIMLCMMIEWMIDKNCPNYFIPSNNMWDNIPSDYDFDLEARSILCSIEDIKSYIKKTEHLQRENVEKKSQGTLAIPKKFLTVIHLDSYDPCHIYHALSGRERFLPSKPLEETEDFTSKMKYLHRALSIHRSLVSHNFENQIEEEMIEEALRCFKQFRETTFDGYTRIQYSLFDSCQDLFQKIMDSDIDCNQSKPTYSVKSDSFVMETLLDLVFQRINDDIGNPFYFICCAYKANFHFTAFENKIYEIKRLHWAKALELCKEALSEYSAALEKFTQWICPARLPLMVFVTKDFADIFDECINFAVNISSPFHNDLETIHFNSVDFLRYLRIQCMRKLDVNFNEEVEIVKMEVAREQTPTRMILCHALRLTSKQN